MCCLRMTSELRVGEGRMVFAVSKDKNMHFLVVGRYLGQDCELS